MNAGKNDPNRRPLWRTVVFETEKGFSLQSLRRGLILIVLVALANAGIGALGFYRDYDHVDMDRLARHNFDKPLGPAEDVKAAVVLIGDGDYEQIFKNKSPIPSKPLLSIVQALCHLQPRPKVIGVDVFTGEWPDAAAFLREPGLQAFEDTPAERAEILTGLAGCPLIWVRDSQQEGSSEGKTDPGFLLKGVVGSSFLPEGPLCTALPIFEPDGDEVIRRYRSWVPAGSNADKLSPYTTFSAALGAPRRNPGDARCNFLSDEHDRPDKSLLISYKGNGNILRLPANMFVPTAPAAGDAFFAGVAKTGKALHVGAGTVVVLGGGYRYARDRYVTPVGPLYGAEILANAAVGRSLSEVRPLTAFLSEVLISTVIFGIVSALPLCLGSASALRYTWSMAASLGCGVVVAFILGWELYAKLGTFNSILAALLGGVVGVTGDLAGERIYSDFKAWRNEWNDRRKPRTRNARSSRSHPAS